jgi:hypothetical protein
MREFGGYIPGKSTTKTDHAITAHGGNQFNSL